MTEKLHVHYENDHKNEMKDFTNVRCGRQTVIIGHMLNEKTFCFRLHKYLRDNPDPKG